MKERDLHGGTSLSLLALGTQGSAFRRMPAAEQPVCGQASEPFHLLVDGGQQSLEEGFEFFLRRVD